MKLKEIITEHFKSNNVITSGVFSFEQKLSALEKDNKFFEEWLRNGAHAQMSFLENNIQVRKNPNLVLTNCKTALIFLFPYSYGHKIRKNIKFNSHASSEKEFNNISNNSLYNNKLISRYVYGKDYHKVLKKQLNKIAENLKNLLSISFNYRPVIDSVPFFDRAHAREATLGFIGKNTMLIRPGMGSFFFIATLLTDIPSEYLIDNSSSKNDPIAALNCGDCRKCLDACPTQALQSDFFLDANRCLSYLTIEHREVVPNEYLPYFKNTLYGCDICQEVCPYNYVTTGFPILKEFSEIHPPFMVITAKEVALMDENQYEKWFGGTAATRAKYAGLVRNALYHLYASLSPDLESILVKLSNSENQLILRTVRQINELILSNK